MVELRWLALLAPWLAMAPPEQEDKSHASPLRRGGMRRDPRDRVCFSQRFLRPGTRLGAAATVCADRGHGRAVLRLVRDSAVDARRRHRGGARTRRRRPCGDSRHGLDRLLGCDPPAARPGAARRSPVGGRPRARTARAGQRDGRPTARRLDALRQRERPADPPWRRRLRRPPGAPRLPAAALRVPLARPRARRRGPPRRRRGTRLHRILGGPGRGMGTDLAAPHPRGLHDRRRVGGRLARSPLRTVRARVPDAVAGARRDRRAPRTCGSKSSPPWGACRPPSPTRSTIRRPRRRPTSATSSTP
jgi:hypothetical protein